VSTPSSRAVLEALVDCHGTRGRALSVDAVATAVGADRGVVREHLRRLVDCELAAAEPGGYRPTVTGREFLALGAEVAVVDPDPGDGAGSETEPRD